MTTAGRLQSGDWRSLGAFKFAGTPSVTLDNFTHAGYISDLPDGGDDVAWDAIAFQPLAGPPANRVVAMGDSYSSGEGTTPADSWAYYRETDHDGTDDKHRNACHRPKDAWSRLGKLSDAPSQSIGSRTDSFDPALEYHMSACAGARAEHVSKGQNNVFNAGEYGEPAQIDQGYLDQHTSLVTMSIGGNDAKFTDILANCVPYAALHRPGSCADMVLSGDTGGCLSGHRRDRRPRGLPILQ